MRLLRLAIENQRWDLAAHTIILASARLLSGPRKSKRGGDNVNVAGNRNKDHKKESEK